MKKSPHLYSLIILSFICIGFTSCGQNDTVNTLKEKSEFSPVQTENGSWKPLTPEETKVIVHKGTEYPYSGEFVDHHEEGVYTCKRCDFPLFESSSKFNSKSGWPSFDDMINNHVEELIDEDGYRTEIVCRNCKGHLGHVFLGEGFTEKNTRHCVNSISLNFEENQEINSNNLTEQTMDTAIFASGCFWGTEYFFEKADGVISTQVGYIGGYKDNPTYEEVCSNLTGHAEAVRVVYDPSKTDYEALCKLFYETHDPTQVNRQGPDIGTQYRTEIFYLDDDQKLIAEKLKNQLEAKGLVVATNISKATKFWEGEDYHEHYYSNKGGTPYCHAYTKRFD